MMPHRFVGGSDESPQGILKALKANPGMTFIPHGMQEMYVLYGDNTMLCFVHDFIGMDDKQVNQFLQDSLKKVRDAANSSSS